MLEHEQIQDKSKKGHDIPEENTRAGSGRYKTSYVVSAGKTTAEPFQSASRLSLVVGKTVRGTRPWLHQTSPFFWMGVSKLQGTNPKSSTMVRILDDFIQTLIKFYCPHPLLLAADLQLWSSDNHCLSQRFALATGLWRTGEQARAWYGLKQCNYPRTYSLTPLKESGIAFGLHPFSLPLCGQDIKPLNAKIHALHWLEKSLQNRCTS